MDVQTLKRIIEAEIERQHPDGVKRNAHFLLVQSNIALNCEDIAKAVAESLRAFHMVN